MPEKSTKNDVLFSLTAIPNVKSELMHTVCNMNRNFSIRVEFDYNFNNIHVYVKNNLDYFERDEEKKMLKFKCQSLNYEIFEKIIPIQGEGAMLSVFGKYVSNQNTKCPIYLKYSFSKFQSKRTQQYKAKFSHTDNIIKMLQNIPGKVLFRYQAAGHGGYQFKWKNGKISTVNAISWLFPWSTEIIQKVHFI